MRKGSLPADRRRKPAEPQPRTTVNINTASVPELSALPHIGDTIANRIIQFRTAHGPFPRTDYLMLVPGISERRFREIRHLVTVE